VTLAAAACWVAEGLAAAQSATCSTAGPSCLASLGKAAGTQHKPAADSTAQHNTAQHSIAPQLKQQRGQICRRRWMQSW
jgi:hypothetical protein